MRNILLISSSRVHGTNYLDHAEAAIASLLGPIGRVLFLPYALHDRDGYAAMARDRFSVLGLALDSAHEASDPVAAVEGAEAIFIGGGNTFRLLKVLYDFRLLVPIRRRVAAGVPYIGSSAGSNVACPTIRTTKDMPIVQPPSFEALNLVRFQISPHYLDPDPASTHMGETQEERILQYLEENDRTVVGLREGAMLRVADTSVSLLGAAGARIFRKGMDPIEVLPGAPLDALLSA
jgi:dipeptidase E